LEGDRRACNPAWFVNRCEKFLMIERAVGIAGLALAVLSYVGPVLFPTVNKKLAWGGFIFGVLLLGGAAATAFLPDGNAQSIPAQQSAQNITSYGQQGGITAGVVNIGPQRLVFSSELGSELLARMPATTTLT
jgi:hypothetical protein